MSALAQQWLAYAAVLVAMGWLLRRWLRRRSGGACDRCESSAPRRSRRPTEPERGIRPASLRVLR